MVKFVAKERNPNEACFVIDEDSQLVFELQKPADLAQAEAVAKYLNTNVRAVGSNAKITYAVTEGGRVTKRGTIGGHS
ncbi:MAG: hypothetical protein F9K29_08105 [Hyphomicrobiaceae bacterium]|nr:MAG: hypothetical protein F9K29_08105 [Hyphomicrobiaceae bacterium]